MLKSCDFLTGPITVAAAEANILRIDLSQTFDEAYRFHFNSHNSSVEFSFISKQDAYHLTPLQVSLEESKVLFSESICAVLTQVDPSSTFQSDDTYQLQPKRTILFDDDSTSAASTIDRTTLGVRYMQWVQDMNSVILFPKELNDDNGAATSPAFKQFTIKACDKKALEWKLVSQRSHRTFQTRNYHENDASLAARLEQNELAVILAEEQGLGTTVTKPFAINDGLSSIFEERSSFLASSVNPRNLVDTSEEFYAASLSNKAAWRGSFYMYELRQADNFLTGRVGMDQARAQVR